jgi:hypothetical protein
VAAGERVYSLWSLQRQVGTLCRSLFVIQIYLLTNAEDIDSDPAKLVSDWMVVKQRDLYI